jgi:molybdopterin/thiamine biosynthesis adenylyltransferase
MTLRLDREALEGPRDRYHRQSLIAWWDQARVRSAKILVIGAGALGNEILKLLGLLGVGKILVYDPDRIELTNLSRCVLFRDHDEGRHKAEVAAERVRALNPDVAITARCENIVTQAGLGPFFWADVVIGAVDNREARVYVNASCARAGRSWVDGAIEGLSGIVRVFEPAATACYECTMNATDRKLLAERRSCALLARDVVARGHVPTTAVTASLVAALQVQEAIKLLHGQPCLHGEGIHIHGLWGEFSRVSYPRREDCLGHESGGPVTALGCGAGDITLDALLGRAEAELGHGAEIDLSRDVVLSLSCPACGTVDPGRAVLGAIREADAACPRCGVHRVVDTISTLARDGRVDLGQSPADLGIPRFDALFPRLGMSAPRTWLLDGDAAAVLGPLAPMVDDVDAAAAAAGRAPSAAERNP